MATRMVAVGQMTKVFTAVEFDQSPNVLASINKLPPWYPYDRLDEEPEPIEQDPDKQHDERGEEP